MSFRFASPIVFSVSLFATLTLAASARAECTDNADCPDGTTCESVGDTACAKPDIDCVGGAECEIVDCEPEQIKACVPSECDADADCGEDGLICMQQSYEQCSGGGETPACPPNADCVEPEPAVESCETVTEAYCAPRWVGSCEVAADCGAGFTCEEYESCGCSGSSGGGADPGSAGGAGAEDPAPTPEDSCSCEATGEFYCKLTQRECSDASECPADWSCDANPEGGVCTAGPGMEPECTEPDPAKLCFPPNWELVNGGYGGIVYAEDGENSSSDGSGGPTKGVAEPVDDDQAAAPSGSNASTDSDGGCAVAPATGRSTTGLGAVMGLLGLGLLARRRKDASTPLR